MSKPAFIPDQIKEIASKQTTAPVALVGYRAYKEQMNKRGVFDDAIFLITPEGVYSFNANCDPSYYKPGIASLDLGVYKYKLGTHGLSKPKWRQYEALVQASTVNITRDGGKKERGFFGINIHKGGLFGSTSSLGCQTIQRDQWDEFISLVKSNLKKHGMTEIHYILVEQR